jgi:hypothetical protein
MNDTATRTERPPNWDECKKMPFDQLARFLERALEKLPDPSVPDNEALPRSQEELVALCDMLREKADALKDAPHPEPPTDDRPEPPGPFTPSYELRSMYNKLKRFQRRVNDAYRDNDSEIVIEYVEDELEKVEREVALVERREEQEHDKHVAEYREASRPYWDRLRLWEAEEEKRWEAEASRDAAVRRMYRRAKRASSPKPTGRVPFEILPPGEATEDRVRGYYDGLRRQGNLPEFDQDRLDKVLALPWEDWRPGTAGKYGYSIFTFAHTEKVLLECPVYANAIYVLNNGADRLLEMNKQELIASDKAERIFHTGPWYERLKKKLGIP